MKHTLKSFCELVEKARYAATRYYELSAKAKKSKHPDDFKAAKDMLLMAKNLEKQVDEAIVEIKIQLNTPPATPVKEAIKVEPLEDKPL